MPEALQQVRVILAWDYHGISLLARNHIGKRTQSRISYPTHRLSRPRGGYVPKLRESRRSSEGYNKCRIQMAECSRSPLTGMWPCGSGRPSAGYRESSLSGGGHANRSRVRLVAAARRGSRKKLPWTLQIIGAGRLLEEVQSG